MDNDDKKQPSIDEAEKAVMLRAHHGMCFKFFQGKGYSEGFVGNMASMKEYLEKDNPIVRVVDKDDVVCRHCPNLTEKGCISYGKVENYDRGVLKALSVEPGTTLRYSEFSSSVAEKIINAGLREKICGDCQWNELCK